MTAGTIVTGVLLAAMYIALELLERDFEKEKVEFAQ